MFVFQTASWWFSNVFLCRFKKARDIWVLHVFYVISGQITLKFYGDDFFMSLKDFGCFESHVSMKQVCSTMGGVSCPYSLRPSSYSSSTSTVTQRCRDARDMTLPSTIWILNNSFIYVEFCILF